MVALSVFAATFVTSCLLVATTPLHGSLSLDSTAGVQKVHTVPAPRIGGVALAVGALVGWLSLAAAPAAMWAQVCLCMVPACVSGLAEDLSKRVGVAVRLLGTLASGALFAVVTDDALMPPGQADGVKAVCALGLTAVLVAGSANAFNIIDGVNGLASGTGLVVSLAFAAIAVRVNDADLVAVCLVIAAALGGFLVVNFPRGRLFLGDAGAYGTGGVLAAVALTLPARHVDITPLVGLLALSYPALETVVSIHRRLRKRRRPTEADRLHLHSLVHRSLALRVARAVARPALRNPVTAILVGALPLVATTWSVVAYRRADLSLLGLLVVFVGYVGLYRRVARFGH